MSPSPWRSHLPAADKSDQVGAELARGAYQKLLKDLENRFLSTDE